MRISRLLITQNFATRFYGSKQAKSKSEGFENKANTKEGVFFQINLLPYCNSLKSKSSFQKYSPTKEELNNLIQAIQTSFDSPNWTLDYKTEEFNSFFKGNCSLDTLAFFAHCLKTDPKNSSDLAVLKRFQVLTSDIKKEDIGEITQSDFLYWLISENKTCAKQLFNCEFKSLFSDIESLKKLNKYFKDDLLRGFIQKDILENKDSILNYDFQGKYINSLIKKLNPVIEFSRLKEAKIFYPLFKERSTKDTAEIIKIIQSRILKNPSNKKVKELYDTIAPLLKAKTPTGEFLFTTSIQSDTGQKNMLSGIENFLEGKANDSKHYQKLLNLLDLTTKGVIPSYILGVLPKNAQINPEIDFEITKLTESEIPEFLNEKEALTLSKPKDVVKIKDKLYYRNSTSLIPLELSEDCFKKLFTSVNSIAFSQGQNDNCYFVCAIYNLMQNPDTRGMIYQLFKETSQGEIVITIPTLKGVEFIYNPNEFSDTEKNINASLGIKLLEDSYAKAMEIKYSRNNSGLDILSYGQESYVYNALIEDCACFEFYVTEGNSTAVEQDTTIEYLKEENKLFGDEIQQLKYTLSKNSLFQGGLSRKQIQEFQEKIKRYETEILSNQKIIFELDKIQTKRIKPDELMPLIKKLINKKGVMLSAGALTDGDKDRLINANHAYIISELDDTAGLIKLINPWNTAFSVSLTFEEFKNWFNSITVMDLYKTVC